jgi:hypothetical protein
VGVFSAGRKEPVSRPLATRDPLEEAEKDSSATSSSQLTRPDSKQQTRATRPLAKMRVLVSKQKTRLRLGMLVCDLSQ